MTSIVNHVCKHEFNYDRRKYKLRFTIDIEPECTETVRSICEDGGCVAGIELVKYIDVKPFDEKQYTKIKTERLSLGICKKNNKPSIWLNNVLKKAKSEKYDHMVIKMNRHDKGQESVNVDILTKKSNALEEVLTDRHYLITKQKLNQIENDFVGEIAKDMNSILIKKRR